MSHDKLLRAFTHKTTFGTLKPLLVAVLLSTGSAFAASGQFTFVTGDVRVVTKDNRTVQATRGMDVNAGDVVVTGTDGMAQLTMVDSARLSLRSGTQLRIDSYAAAPGGAESSVVSLVRGTLRTFTGLLSPSAREKFSMRTKVATVGIRGSGNILYHCETNCPQEQGQQSPNDTTINHTIEGSHNVFSIGFDKPLTTGPGQTVQVVQGQPPQSIPTPAHILESGRVMTGKNATAGDPQQTMGEGRNFASADTTSTTLTQSNTSVVGNNGLGFTVTDASGNIVGSDPLGLRDIVVAGGVALASQATQNDTTLEREGLRGFTSYAGLQSGLSVSITGGQLGDIQTATAGGTQITLGTWAGGNLSVQGTSFANGGTVHFGYAAAGFPSYLSEVLTGTATYTLAAATSPTNQLNTSGSLGTATLNVNFSNRTLNAALAVNMPQAGTNGGGSWNLNANNVPFSLNSFIATTADRLVITNGNGVSSTGNSFLFGGIEGSFVGTSLAGAILGYSFSDQTSSNPNNFNTVSGVAALTGPSQQAAAEFRIGLVSRGSTFLAFNRPDEVTQNTTTGGITAFSGAANLASGFVPYAGYQIGTAALADVGFDAATGLSWGRWSGGSASVSNGTSTQSISLVSASQHYIFAASQSGPTALPLTGTASYDVLGSTRPTDASGQAGTFNTATLNANFSNRTVDLGVNFTMHGQTWNASASNVPIYRDTIFSAVTGGGSAALPGVPNLVVTCSPSCGQGAQGTVDGFFTGRSGQGAGMIYNVGGNTGTVALGRRGG
jgi:hypothetical protein